MHFHITPSSSTPLASLTAHSPPASVSSFQHSLLPDLIKRYCDDVSTRLSAPTAYVLASTLCVLGAAIGCKCGIRPKRHDSWLVTPNVWAAMVGEASSMKSPAMSQPLSLLHRVEHDLHQQTERPAHRLVANDATGEKLVELLSQNPDGLLVVRDELAGVFESWQRSGRQGERQLYLESWNGSAPYTVDRIGRGTVTVKHLCLSVMGTIQPAQLARHLGGNGVEDGLAQRFQLLVFPEPRQRQFCDKPEDLETKSALERTLMRLATADFRHLCGTPDTESIPSLAFSAEAYERYKAWWMENASRTTDPVLSSFITKHERLVPALSLIDHLTCSFSDGTPKALMPVPLYSIERAIAQTDFFRSQVERVIETMRESRALTTREVLLSKITSGQVVTGFTARDILRGNWSGLTHPKTLEETLTQLVEEGLLKREATSHPAGGRKTIRYELVNTH